MAACEVGMDPEMEDGVTSGAPELEITADREHVGQVAVRDGKVYRGSEYVGEVRNYLKPGPAGKEVSAQDGKYLSCWYFIQYYIDTGEIIQIINLGCSGGGVRWS